MLRYAVLTRLLLPLAIVAPLGACQTFGDGIVTGSIAPSAPAAATTEEGWRAIAARAQPAYEKNPADAAAALAYGRALRQLGRNSQAVAVLQTAAIKNAENQALLGEYGRALAADGNFQQAFEVLGRAHTPDRPDWRILMAQGAVLDQLDRGPEARDYYMTALRIRPNDPAILSNLGLSYALANDLPKAESTLRQAAADPKADARARQNLVLVLGLEGKFDEAQDMAKRDLDPTQAAQTLTYLRGLVGQSNNWQKLRQLDARPKAPAGVAG